jgi:hypothetical protein
MFLITNKEHINLLKTKYVLKRDALYFGRQANTFRRNLLLTSLRWRRHVLRKNWYLHCKVHGVTCQNIVTKQPERLGLRIPPKYWHLSSKLHSITCQKDLMFVSAALKSSNLIQIFKSCPRRLVFQMAHLYAGYSHLPCLRVFLYSLLCFHVQS